MGGLDDEDRAMLSSLRAQSRRNTARKLIQWALILVPTVPVITVATFFFGWLLGLVPTVVATVAWGIAVQKLFPVRDSLTGGD